MGKKVKIVLDMQAHFEEKITFFGRKVNKVPCIMGEIWGKINLLGIFGVETHWIIGQKSQNRRPKSFYFSQIAHIMPSTFLTFCPIIHCVFDWLKYWKIAKNPARYSRKRHHSKVFSFSNSTWFLTISSRNADFRCIFEKQKSMYFSQF